MQNLVDQEAFNALLEGDEALRAELMHHFAETCARVQKQIAVETPDKWEAPLHELKGAASAMQANAIVLLCEEYSPNFAESEANEWRESFNQLVTATLAIFQSGAQ